MEINMNELNSLQIQALQEYISRYKEISKQIPFTQTDSDTSLKNIEVELIHLKEYYKTFEQIHMHHQAIESIMLLKLRKMINDYNICVTESQDLSNRNKNIAWWLTGISVIINIIGIAIFCLWG